MPRPRNSKLLTGALLALAVVPLAGCADYLNHRDSITLAAGDANNSNIAIHTIDPQANRGEQAVIYSDGKYIRNVMDDYHERPVAVPQNGYGVAQPSMAPQPAAQ